MTPKAGQLSLGFDHSPSNITVTRVLETHPHKNRILTMVGYTRRYFPELNELQIKVGLTRIASGMAVPGGTEIWLNPAAISYHTIAHELIHLLQRRDGKIPQGERSCDVFSMARDRTLNDVSPSYVRTPYTIVGENGLVTPWAQRMLYNVATEAVDRRRSGFRSYIVWFEQEVARLTQERLVKDGVIPF